MKGIQILSAVWLNLYRLSVIRRLGSVMRVSRGDFFSAAGIYIHKYTYIPTSPVSLQTFSLARLIPVKYNKLRQISSRTSIDYMY